MAAGNPVAEGSATASPLADAVRAMYGYNRWAMQRVLDAAADLPAEEWVVPGTAGRGSIRDTLVHVVSAQRGWLSWWTGALPVAQAYRLGLDPSSFPDAGALELAWEQLCDDTDAFLAPLTDADMARDLSADLPDGRVFRLTRWKMLLHVVNHGTQHRSEAAAMLTAFGHSPGYLDALVFFGAFGSAGG